jgi:hypothetical protein
MQYLIDTVVRLRNWLRAQRHLNLVVKITVTLLLGAMLYYEVAYHRHIGEVWAAFRNEAAHGKWWYLVLALLLMPFNWLAETEKWRGFVARYEDMPRSRAFLAVMTGVAFSLFTPNRVGEYGGRILYVQARNQWRAVVANLVGNFCQFMVLLGMGVLGSLYVLKQLEVIRPIWATVLILGATAALPTMFWLYYHFELVIDFIKRLRLAKPLLPLMRQLNLGVVRQFSKAERTAILGWAVLRFFIYAAQYFLLLRFFGIHTDVLSGFSGIAALFLLQTSIPLPPLAGLVARGNLAVLLWQQFGANEVSALAATFGLWVINLVLPALIGTFSLFYVNISKSLGHESNTDAICNAPPVSPKTAPVGHHDPAHRTEAVGAERLQ